MGIFWSPCCNIAIILALHSWFKWAVWLHIAFFTLAIGLTLGSSIPILIDYGIIDRNSTQNYDDYSAATLNTHFILGIVCMASMTLVGLIGLITKLMNLLDARSKLILWVRRVHVWSGYVAAIVCKANIYILGEDAGGWIACDVIFILIYILMIIFWPRLEARGISPKV